MRLPWQPKPSFFDRIKKEENYEEHLEAEDERILRELYAQFHQAYALAVHPTTENVIKKAYFKTTADMNAFQKHMQSCEHLVNQLHKNDHRFVRLAKDTEVILHKKTFQVRDDSQPLVLEMIKEQKQIIVNVKNIDLQISKIKFKIRQLESYNLKQVYIEQGPDMNHEYAIEFRKLLETTKNELENIHRLLINLSVLIHESNEFLKQKRNEGRSLFLQE